MMTTITIHKDSRWCIKTRNMVSI